MLLNPNLVMNVKVRAVSPSDSLDPLAKRRVVVVLEGSLFCQIDLSMMKWMSDSTQKEVFHCWLLPVLPTGDWPQFLQVPLA